MPGFQTTLLPPFSGRIEWLLEVDTYRTGSTGRDRVPCGPIGSAGMGPFSEQFGRIKGRSVTVADAQKWRNGPHGGPTLTLIILISM
jgi:hypothetical protein